MYLNSLQNTKINNKKNIFEIKLLSKKQSLQFTTLTAMAALLTACDFGAQSLQGVVSSGSGTTTEDDNYNVILGTDGDDTLLGTADEDKFISGLGEDILDGQDGVDQIDYSNSGSAVTVYLDGTPNTGGFSAHDQIRNIENVIGSEFSDVLHGNDSDNIMEGRAGYDDFRGSLGADTIIGGNDIDTMNYSYSPVAVSVSLGGTGVGGYAEGDTYSEIEILAGSAFDDTLSGDDYANVISGQAGNDTFVGSMGADKIYGGEGVDLVTYEASAVGVIAYLNGDVNFGGLAEGDQIESVENLTGTYLEDFLYGDELDNVIDGLSGSDHLYGGAGNDLLVSGADGDTIDGGDDVDLVSYLASPEQVIVHLDGLLINGGHATGDVLTSIEGVIGSEFSDQLYGDYGNNGLFGMGGDDQLSGGAGVDWLSGGDGNDSLEGNAGDDMLFGNDGDDTLVGDEGNDQLYGGTGSNILLGGGGNDILFAGSGVDIMDGEQGSDFVSFYYSNTAVVANLDTGSISGGFANGDSITSIENITGSSYNDTLIGDAGNNILEGLEGLDNLDGGAGIDSVVNFYDGFRFIIDKAAGKIIIADADPDHTMEHADVLTGIETIISTSGDPEDNIDMQDIWEFLDQPNRTEFGDDEANFKIWLGDDAGYNYDGL